MLVSQLLAQIENLDETIEQPTAEIEQRMLPCERRREAAQDHPRRRRAHRRGDRRRARHDIGRFPSDRHAAGWAAVCRGHDESAGKRRSGEARKGNRWLRVALIEGANSAAGRTKDT